VQVAKFSPQHTSVQWTAAAAASCAEFGARAAADARVGAGAGAGAGAGSALIEGCGALRGSIDSALAAGLLSVCPPSYE
jgi:hypothetical protein